MHANESRGTGRLYAAQKSPRRTGPVETRSPPTDGPRRRGPSSNKHSKNAAESRRIIGIHPVRSRPRRTRGSGDVVGIVLNTAIDGRYDDTTTTTTSHRFRRAVPLPFMVICLF